MGRAALGVCFDGGTDDMADAAQHACNMLFPFTTNTGYVISCTGVGANAGAGKLLNLSQSLGNTSAVASRVVTFPVCDPLTFRSGPDPWGLSVTDAGLVAGAVIVTWLIGAAWAYVRRALGDHNESNPD